MIIQQRQEKFRTVFTHRELTLRDLEIMDTDGDGQVTMADFFEFMLVAMDRVDPKLMKDLRTAFNKLDLDGTGVLDKNDLIELARKRLRTTQSKLKLAEYKKKLRDLGSSKSQSPMTLNKII